MARTSARPHPLARLIEEAFRRAGALRRRRPFHPVGVMAEGVLTITGTGPPLGVPLLDTAATHPVQARLSRAAGMPPGLPDVHGLALRLTGGERPVDLLMSSTGAAPVLRHALRPHRSLRGVHTSIVPYRTPAGPLLLAAQPDDGAAVRRPFHPRRLREVLATQGITFTLRAATPLGAWRDVGRIDLGLPGDAGAGRPRFDPVLNAHADLASYALWAWPRLPAYRGARRGYPGGRARR
ncbi:MAG TPA: hypothetical protein VNT51_09815 [Miltoncostaeaceae bacterium]|nr:hypothetical protein [Miltoncostaeaceae bacterium]